MCFSLKFCEFSELCQFCCSAGVLPAWCVYTHTDTKGKQRKASSVRNILKSLEKNTIFNQHPVRYGGASLQPTSSTTRQPLVRHTCNMVPICRFWTLKSSKNVPDEWWIIIIFKDHAADIKGDEKLIYEETAFGIWKIVTKGL